MLNRVTTDKQEGKARMIHIVLDYSWRLQHERRCNLIWVEIDKY